MAYYEKGGSGSGSGSGGAESLFGGFPLLEILGGISGLSGILGIIGAGNSPKDEMVAQIMEKLNANLDKLGQPSFTKDEVGNLVTNIKKGIDITTDVSKTKIGSSLAESMGAAGVPGGQAKASMYVSELAPLDAAATQAKAGADQWGGEFWANLDANAKNRMIQAFATAFGGANMMQSQTGLQRGISTGLGAFDLFGKGAGNLAEMWKNFTHKDIKP